MLGTMRILAIYCLLGVVAAVAQDSKPETAAVSEPEFSDVFYRLDAGKLMPLERQTANVHGRAKGFIVMTMKTTSEFPGAKSPVRFHAGETLEFVVRSGFAASTLDPNTIYCLRKLEAKRHKRELVTMAGHASPLGASMNRNLAQGVLPVNFARYGASSIRLISGVLARGEYALGLVHAQTMFCFGVD